MQHFETTFLGNTASLPLWAGYGAKDDIHVYALWGTPSSSYNTVICIKATVA
jgi:hypothetical protein